MTTLQITVEAPWLLEAPWLSHMLAKLRVREIPGPRAAKEILDFHAVTAAGIPADGDETAWCSSFQCWGLEQAGLPHTRNKLARSFERYGVKLAAPRRGAITVLSRGLDPKQGHVGSLLHWDDELLWLLGGNQGNMVSVAAFPRNRLVSFRWPLKPLDEAA